MMAGILAADSKIHADNGANSSKHNAGSLVLGKNKN